MAQSKRKPVVHVRARADSWDWLVIGRNGLPVAKSPGVYKTKAHARRGGLSFAESYLKLRKVEVVNVA